MLKDHEILSDEQDIQQMMYEEMLWQEQNQEVLYKINSMGSQEDSDYYNELDRAIVEEDEPSEEEKKQEE